MRRFWLIPLVVLVALGLAWRAPAQVVSGPCPSIPRQVAPFAFEQLTVTYTPAVAFTAATYAPAGARAADLAMFTVETAATSTTASSIRYRIDGTAPTAFIGHHTGAVLTPFAVCGAGNVARFSSILPAGSNAISAVVNVTYYRTN
jgi:hypothetical protein